MMGRPSIDLTGQRYGRWVVLSRDGFAANNAALFRCRCDCGTERTLVSSVLRTGRSTSCGCYRSEHHSQLRHGHAKKDDKSPTYLSWRAMLIRCTNEKHPGYHRYGGRGIKVCEQWKSFDKFLADMGERPKGLWLERRDNNRGYEPDNCEWATPKAQANNRRNNRKFRHENSDIERLRDS